MEKTAKYLTTLSLIFSLAALIYSCGGDGPPGVTTLPAPTKAASATTKAVVAAVGASSKSTGSFKPGDSGSENDPQRILRGLDLLKEKLRGNQGRFKALQSITTGSPMPCDPTIPDSGTMTTKTDDNNTPDNPLDDTTTATFTNCRENRNDGIQVLKNGTSISMISGFATTTITFTETFTNYEEKEFNLTKSTTNPIYTLKMNETFTFSGKITYCTGSNANGGPSQDLMDGIITFNGTEEEIEDADANGTPELDELFSSTNLSITGSDTYISETCGDVKTSLVINGTASFEDKLHPTDKYKATFKGATITYSPTTKTINNVIVKGEEEVFNGQVVVESDCLTGTYDIKTVTPFFIPDVADCPVLGEMHITGSGVTSTVTATSIGGMNIDATSNGPTSDDKSFKTCDEAEMC